MAHFTCVGATVDELRSTLDEMSALRLRQRPRPARRSAAGPGGVDEDRGRPRVLARARRAHQRRLPGFAIGAACFPETHIHATSPEDDLRYLKEKVDAGVGFLITQLFFDNALYYDFVARARAIGIEVPDRARHPAHHDLQPALARDEHVRRDDPRPRAHRPAPAHGRATRRWPSSAWPTRRCSAPTCWPTARPGSTSTRSTAPRRRARSSARCASGARGTASTPPSARLAAWPTPA